MTIFTVSHTFWKKNLIELYDTNLGSCLADASLKCLAVCLEMLSNDCIYTLQPGSELTLQEPQQITSFFIIEANNQACVSITRNQF